MTDKKNLIELTNKLYKLTLLFPKKEPLRYRMRETADEVLVNFVFWENLDKPNPGKFVEKKERNQKELIFEVEKNLDVLNSYFEIVKWQNWLSYFDVLEIQEQYDMIKGDFKKEIGKLEAREEEFKNLEISFPQEKTRELAILDKSKQIIAKPQEEENEKKESNPRKEKILKILERVKRIQVGEMNKFFPDLSKRTLRRDFHELVKQGLIERIGEKNNTFYQLRE